MSLTSPSAALCGAFLIIAGCTADHSETAHNSANASGANASGAAPRAGDAEVRERAERALSAAGGGERINSTLPAFSVSARALGGTTAPIHWGASAWGVRELSVPTAPTARSTLVIAKPNGRLSVSLANANGWRFYVECDIQATPTTLPVRWDAMMAGTGPVDGIATRDPATRRYYFATPVANMPEARAATFTVDTMAPNTGTEGYLVIHDCTVLPFN